MQKNTKNNIITTQNALLN